MVKSARSKALAKKRQNQLSYVLLKKIKEKNRSRWNIVRATFYFLVLFYKSRTNRISKDLPCNLLECPISVNYFLNRNKVLAERIDTSITDSDVNNCSTLINRHETVTTTDNIISVRTHTPDSCIIKDVLDNICRKVCRMVSKQKYFSKKIQSCHTERQLKRQRDRYLYHNGKIKGLKRLTYNLRMYHENKTKRDKQKQRQKKFYHSDELLRKKKCSILKRKYQENQFLREKKRCHMRDIYRADKLIREMRCRQLRQRYQTSDLVRQKKCTQLQNRYQTNEFIREKKCTQLRETYNRNENVREEKKRKNHLEYMILEKRQHKLFSLREKYRSNLRRLEDTARNLLNTYDSTDGLVNQIQLVNVLKQTKINQNKLYATMAKQIREKYLKQADQKKRKLDFYEQQFRNHIQQMPKYVCTVCHRCMFQSDVVVCNREKYKIKFNEDNWSSAMICFTGSYVDEFAFDPCKRVEWVCKACHNVLWKGNVPPRSVSANNILGAHLPEDSSVE